jgi:hypothetical protein
MSERFDRFSWGGADELTITNPKGELTSGLGQVGQKVSKGYKAPAGYTEPELDKNRVITKVSVKIEQ